MAKTPPCQQRVALMWVLNRAFFAQFCRLPFGDRDPVIRRRLLLEWWQHLSPRLQDASWSIHDITHWLLEVKEETCWMQSRCDV